MIGDSYKGQWFCGIVDQINLAWLTFYAVTTTAGRSHHPKLQHNFNRDDVRLSTTSKI